MDVGERGFVWGQCSVKRKYRSVKLRTTAALRGVSVSVCVCCSPLGQKEFNQNKSSYEESSSSKPEANQPKVKQNFKLQLYFTSYSFQTVRENRLSKWYSRETARSFSIEDNFSKVMCTNGMNTFSSKSIFKCFNSDGERSPEQECLASLFMEV